MFIAGNAALILAQWPVALITTSEIIEDAFGYGDNFFADIVVGAVILGLHWAAFFLPLRHMLRRRFARRERPVWWSDMPGLAMGIAFAVLVVVAARHSAHTITGEEWTYWMIAFSATGGAAVLVYLGAVVEALRPDRDKGLPQVFD